jgi:oligopeptide transport system ATP-binding protein
MTAPLVEIAGVSKHFRRGHALPFRPAPSVRALDDVSLAIARGETLGLVGESGSGKSTLGRCLAGLHRPDAGSIRFDGAEIANLGDAARAPFRRRIQMIFQDPYGSLNPRMTVGGAIEEHLRAQRFGGGGAIRARAAEVLDRVGLSARMKERYPHELSGGQRQRVVIARAIATHPDFVIADEPVSALDVSTRAQVINLMRDLQRQLHLTYLFISHDLSIVAHACRRVAVMYLGQIVEVADVDELFERPRHHYSHALLKAIPVPDPDASAGRALLKGEVPSALVHPRGCRFHPRCPAALPVCAEVTPQLMPAGGGHFVACHNPRGSNDPP